MPDWFTGLQPAVQAAVITATVGLVAAVVTGVGTATNVLLKTWLDRRAENAQLERAQRDAYRQYAEPLTAAATALYWRLREVFETPGGGFFLQVGGGMTRFEDYKVSSTRYRVAALFGWFAALRRELLRSATHPDPSVSPMRKAISHVESAFADGTEIEAKRARALAASWGLELDESAVEVVGRRVDSALKRALHAAGVGSARDLSTEQAGALHSRINELVSSAIGAEALPQGRIDATRDSTNDALCAHEAWLYRDWQHALGDLMLAGGDSRPSVRDFLSFCDLHDAGSPSERALISRIDDVIVGLDVEGDPLEDARIDQLHAVFLALAELIRAFHTSEPRRSQAAAGTLDAIEKTLTRASAAKGEAAVADPRSGRLVRSAMSDDGRIRRG